MTYPYASSDPAILSFIANQNSARPITSSDPFLPQQMQNGVAGTTTDNTLALASLTTSGSLSGPISLGSGFNAVILAGAHSTTAASGGAADSFSFSVDGSGTVQLMDNNTGQAETLTGATYLIFNDAASAGGGLTSVFFIGNGQQSEVDRLYSAALGRQPDLGGVEYYTHQLSAGYSFTQLANEFMSSPEFQTRFGSGLTDSQFVSSLYQNVLHRTPSATESAYYTAALANAEAGSIVNTANPVMWTRAQELLNFVNSPENQQDVAGYVINTSSGGYADTNVLLSAQTVVSQAASNGSLNTALINPSSLPAGSNDNFTSPDGTFAVAAAGQGGLDPTRNPAVAGAAGTNQTIYLSSVVPKGVGDGSTTIYSAASGGDILLSHGGDQFFLSGTNNTVVQSAFAGAIVGGQFRFVNSGNAAPTPVYGFQGGDYISLDQRGLSTWPTATILDGTTAHVNGANLTFSTSTYVINVGTVTDDSAATMAAAANKVYSVAGTAHEGAYFVGTDQQGNTVVHGWYAFGTNSSQMADQNNTHQVNATDFYGGVVLSGIPESSIHATWFH